MTARPRIAVVRALRGLGDMLCAVPALAALRRAHPGAEITLVGLPAGRWVQERFAGLIDAWRAFPGFPGIPEQPCSQPALEAFLTRARAAPYDLAVQMHGSGEVSNTFTALLGAHRIAGFHPAGRERPAGVPGFLPYPDHGSEVHRWLLLAGALGCSTEDDHLSFPVSPADRDALQGDPLLGPLEDGRFVCVHAGASERARRWPAQRFARVADELAARGHRIVLTGTLAERPVAARVAATMRHAVVNAAGATSLGAAAALLERAALLVTNDTGMSHLAAALGTPSVVVFLASDPERWAPLDRERHRPVIARPLAARLPASMHVSPREVPGTEEVLGEALELLSGTMKRRTRTERAPRHGAIVAAWAGDATAGAALAPALRALRRSAPGAPIVLLWPDDGAAPPGIEALADRCIRYPSAGRGESLPAADETVQALAAVAPREAIVFTAPGATPYTPAYLCYLAGIRRRVGCSGEFAGSLLSETFPPPGGALRSDEERHLALLAAAGRGAPPPDAPPPDAYWSAAL